MKDFLRAVRVVLKNRATFVGVLVTSLLVGLLWGANIGAVYPLVEAVFHGKSLQQWIDEEITETRTKIAELQRQMEEFPPPAAGAEEVEAAERTRRFRESRLEAEQRALAWWLWAKPYIDGYTPRTPFQTLVVIVLALVVGTILKDAFIVTNMLLVSRLIQLTVFDLRKQFYRQTLRLDLASFGENNTSELLSRFTFDVNCLTSGLVTLFGRALREPLKMACCLLGACLINWRLLLFSLLLTPPAIYAMRRLAMSLKRANRRAMEEMAQLYNAMTETFNGIQTVKAFTMEQAERNRFYQIGKEFYRKAMRIAIYGSLTKPITELLGIGVISVALVAGAYLVLNQETHLLGIKMSDRPMSLGALLLFYGFLAGVSDPARKLSEILSALQGGAAAAERIYAMMDREPKIVDPPQPKTTARPHQRLVFEHVKFSYRPEQPVLQDVNFEIRYGETVAIVGPNGCGKTTLINLIPRFYDPVSGCVRLDGIDLRAMRVRDVRTRIGLVTQQTHLFDDTVLNNIRYGTPRATDEEVVAAARKAHADRFITQNLSHGYQTLVGQSGSRLSGGQRQRIALARAILRDPEILILDEATSQIDLESEQLIHSALQEFVRGRTTIVITHRLSTLALAHRIMVMEAGRIVDFAPHDELLTRCPLYQRLHEIKFKRSA